MRAEHLAEPELEFGGRGRHVDVRFGLMRHGPLDRGQASAPTEMKLGLIGTPETLDALTGWLDRCRAGVPAKQSKQPNLFPPFPGCTPVFGADIVLDPALRGTVPTRALLELAARPSDVDTVDRAVRLFLDEAAALIESVRPDVLVCAPPADLLAALEREDPLIRLDDDAPSEDDEPVSVRQRAFHDVLKARGMGLGVPIQMVRPSTYEGPKARQRRKSERDRGLQDSATRAWNFFTALYYKAGGTPWRIARGDEYATCYVGVSFYKTVDEMQLMTSMAQVFNARGDGVVVRGGPARVETEDRHPHLERDEAERLLRQALQAYYQVHKTRPARLAVHKTSPFDEAELAGFRAAAATEQITSVDLLSVTKSYTRLFRRGYYPPLRGTLLTLDDADYVLYLKGSVEFFRTWPGMYVPLPIGFRLDDAEQPARVLAQEMLALSKQNWNNTQFDGGWPITLRAAQRVGSIMKHIGPHDPIQTRYSYFM
jgi:hypothetical protein